MIPNNSIGAGDISERGGLVWSSEGSDGDEGKLHRETCFV